MRAHPFTCLVLLFVLIAGAEPAFADFIRVGDLLPNAVSADGTVVVGASVSAASSPLVEAFRWTQATGIVGLGFLPGSTSSRGTGLSADGSIAVGGVSGGIGEAFRWTQASGMVGLGFLPGGNQSTANGVSADGAVAVGWSNFPGGAQQAFRWTWATGMVGLGFLPDSNRSEANAVSADGVVVVGSSIIPIAPFTGVDEAFRWTQATGMVGLGFLPGGTTSLSRGVSADGSVIVGAGNYSPQSGYQAFRWTQVSGMVGLGFLPGDDQSFANGVSADGAVVVGASSVVSHPGGPPAEAFFTQAFIWTSTNGMQSVRDVLVSLGNDLTGWRLTAALAISADGTTIVGTGINPSGQGEAWLATLTPAPNRELVNGKVSFEPLGSTFQTTSDTTGCPAGFTGIFQFAARLTNNSEVLLTNLVVGVTTLTNDNLLQNADGGPAGVGARLTVPRQAGFSDGVLQPEEFVDVPFMICLKQLLPFTFLVDVFGTVQ